MLALFPEAKVVANARCWRMMGDVMALDRRGRFQEAKEGQRLPLGGKTLRFIFMPWVHWPETMGVFLEEGPHLLILRLPRRASGDIRKLYAGDDRQFEMAAKRYYAEGSSAPYPPPVPQRAR